jgi:hypothetical protein
MAHEAHLASLTPEEYSPENPVVQLPPTCRGLQYVHTHHTARREGQWFKSPQAAACEGMTVQDFCTQATVPPIRQAMARHGLSAEQIAR